MKTQKITALYERLSKDDGDNQESCSIATQKRILEEFAEQNGLTPYRHWTDDGVSGKDFQRPAFQEMLTEIEAGNIGAVCVKNLDRFGRAYIESGLYREKFRKAGVRFVAVGDAIDTLHGENDFTAFREVINEFYLSEYSKKIKAAFRSRGMAGKHTSSYPPYGYLKSSEDKNQWVVDSEAAEIVKRVYQMTMDGKGPYQIACTLEADKVLIPAAYLATKGAGLHQHITFENPYHWGSSTICAILRKREYLGHTCNFKSKKDSYKDKKNTYVPESEWVIFENTHEAIIDQATFDNVQRIRGNVKRRPDGWGYVHPLTGLVYCADCGGKLYVHRITNGKDCPMYVCGNYGKLPVGSKCSSGHRIKAETLMSLVAEALREVTKYAVTDKEAFARKVQETLAAKQTDEVKTQKKQLVKLKKRAAEIETLFRKIYEDNALGKLPDKRFAALSEEYEREQGEIEQQIPELQTAVERYEGGGERAKQFMELVKRYEQFEELDVAMLNEFVECIVVHERDRKGCMDSPQTVEIHFNFIGEFNVPKEETDPAELAKQQEERRQKEAQLEKYRQNYRQRKASGKQQEYDRRYNERRKAKRAAENVPASSAV